MLALATRSLLLVVLLSGVARSQSPDVITWRIAETTGGYEDIVNYAPANGKEAYSFCTISCNVGDAVLLWESGGSVRHPVIGQSMFRLKNGRFEQLGQGFLKHGFCALSEQGCGTCQATPCSSLGIGCADTYGAGLNDGAGGGRKSQVNSCRGDHIHPYAGPTGPDPNAGRLQVYTTEIDQAVGGNAQAEYFVEGQYVTEDDQVAGNVANNASWRKVSVDSSRDLHIVSGHPTMVQPAIYAWQSADPLVVVREVPNVDEGGPGIHGLYYAAARATNNGDGTWTYSYAVQNLCSDDAGYSFAVPAASSLTLTGSWFTAVEWHSGEPYNNLPWSFSHTGGMARWTCTENHLQNPDANALRWGTLCSFGFTADAAPSAGMAELVLFTSGGLLTTSLSAPDPGAVVGCPGDDAYEDNDDCTAALPLPMTLNSGLQLHGAGSTLDWDYYGFTLADQDTLEVELFFAHSGGDLDLYLYDAGAGGCGDGSSYLLRSQTATDDEYLSYVNNTGGSQSLIIEVRSNDVPTPVACTDYGLRGTHIPYVPPDPCSVPDDGFEDNDTCSTAAPVADGSYAQLWMSDSDQDIYVGDVPNGVTLSYNIYFSDTQADLDLWLWDSVGACGGSGGYLARGYSASDNELVTWTNNTGSTVTVIAEVRMYSAGTQDCLYYDMEVTGMSTSGCSGPDDAHEQNDTCGTAAPLGFGLTSGLWIERSDGDFYAYAVDMAGTIDVTAIFAHADADVDLYLWSAGDPGCATVLGSPLATSTSSTDDEALSWTNNGGAHLDVIVELRVNSGSAGDCADYSLDVGLSGGPCSLPDDGLEENDDCASAVMIGNGLTSDLFVSKSDGDFYLLTLEWGATLDVAAGFVHSNADVDLLLWAFGDAACGSGSATALASSLSTSDDEALSYTNTSGGSRSVLVEVRVKSASAGDCNVYDLSVSESGGPCSLPEDGLEPNDSCVAAAGISPGASTGLFVSKSDRDFYTRSLALGETLSVDASFGHATADVDLLLWNATSIDCGGASGFALASSLSTDDDESASWTNLTGSPVTVVIEVRVKSSSVGDCNLYDLDISQTGGPCSLPDDVLEPNDTCAGATGLADGTWPGLFVAKADGDYHVRTLDLGESLFAAVNFAHATADVDLLLWDSADPGCGTGTATALASSLSTGDNESLSYQNLTGALLDVVVEVRVKPSSSGDCNLYDLQLTGSGGPCSLPDDGFEPNDSCAAAAALPLGLTGGLHASKSAADFYAVALDLNSRLDVSLSFGHATADVDLLLWGAADPGCGSGSGSPLATSLSTSDGESLAYTNTSGALLDVLVEVRIKSSSSGDCNLYDLDAGVSGGPCTLSDDGLEENDSCATALPLGDGFAAGLFVSKADGDFYARTLPMNASLLVDLDFGPATADLDLYLWDASAPGCGSTGPLASSAGGTGQESISYTNAGGAPLDVIVEVRVNLSSAGDCNLYDLTLTETGGPCFLPEDGFEDNDDCPTAVPLSNGAYGGLFVSKADADFFSRMLDVGVELDVNLAFVHANADVDVILWDAASCGGSPLAISASVTNNEALSYTNASGSPLDVVIEVRVSPGSAGDCNLYDLVVGKPNLSTTLFLGDDAWMSPPPDGPLGTTKLDTGAQPIPAGFFGPGSEPFGGELELRGKPLEGTPALGSTDTVVRRLSSTVPLEPGAADTVPIELVALRLESCQPIEVSFNGGAFVEEWMVEVSLSQVSPQTAGSMTILKTHNDGGVFDSILPVSPRLAFTRVSDGAPAVLDPGPALTLSMSGVAWTLVSGPTGYDPAASAIERIASGTTIDGDGDGVQEYTAAGSSNFQAGVGQDGCGWALTTNLASGAGAAHALCAAGDTDGDGWPDGLDSCPLTANPLQRDTDGDGLGDLCDAADSDVHLNELYVDQLGGADDQEFVELLGAPGQSLDGLVLVVVDGDGASAGTVDMVVDLTGLAIGPGGSFVLGGAAVSGVNEVLGTADVFEDGTQTFYLVDVTTTGAGGLSALVGASIDAGGGTSSIGCHVDRIVDRVAITDGDVGDRAYDRAQVLGPDGGLVPAGVYRGGDFPRPWCGGFLDRDSAANVAMPRTPGGSNGGCTVPFDECPCVQDAAAELGTRFCFGDGVDGVVCPCQSPLPGTPEGCLNQTGVGMYLVASGTPSVSNDSLVLTVHQMVPGDLGIYVQNIGAGAPTPFYNGVICLNLDVHLIRHYAPPTVLPTTTDAGGAGVNSQALTVGDWMGDTQPGVTVYYQFWGRDPSNPCGLGANFSSGLAIEWLP